MRTMAFMGDTRRMTGFVEAAGKETAKNTIKLAEFTFRGNTKSSMQFAKPK